MEDRDRALRRRKRGYIVALGVSILVVLSVVVIASSEFSSNVQGSAPTTSSTSSIGTSSQESNVTSTIIQSSTTSTTSTTRTTSTTSATSTISTTSATSTTSETSTTSTTSTTTSTTSTSSTSTSAAGYWLTYHGSNARDGYDTSVPTLTSLSVAWKAQVDGQVYAEPLSFDGSVFVVTENDTEYSFSAATGALQWTRHLGSAVSATVPPLECGGHGPDIVPTIGITGTPVIDSSTGTLYVVAMVAGPSYELYAVDTNTGAIRWSMPISPSGFVSTGEEQRAALTLTDGFVYVPFGGFSWACVPPHGWIVGVSANGNGTQHSYEVPATVEADIWAPEGSPSMARGSSTS